MIFPHAKQAFLHSICKSIVDIFHCFPKRCELDLIVYVQLYRLMENILMDVSDTLLCLKLLISSRAQSNGIMHIFVTENKLRTIREAECFRKLN